MEVLQAQAETPQGNSGGGIRSATVHDLPRILEYGQKFHDQAKQPFQFDREASETFARILIENTDAEILISDTGMIGGVLTPAYCAPEWKMAVELFWWAETGGVKLLKAFERWAAEIGADEVRMTSIASLERADTLLKRLSYAPIEISYRKLVQWQ